MKPFVDLLLWFLIFQSVFLLYLWGTDAEIKRFPLVVLSVLTLTLTLFSVPITGYLFRKSLSIETMLPSVHPDYIWVLSGGISLGETKEDAHLNSATLHRLKAGIKLLANYPNAHLILAGGIHEPKEHEPIEAEVMAKAAKVLGVASEKLIIEGHSQVTREHPPYGIKLLSLNKDAKIIVVTEDWHLRRASQEFQRYFASPSFYPATTYDEPLKMSDFIPNAATLGKSTTYLQEWVGLIAYQAFNLLKPFR